MILATSVEGEAASYVLLFVLVVLGGAGVPMVGTAAVTAAAILASQGTLSIDDVVAVACAGAVLGGLLGYEGGRRWGVELMQRPGRGEERRMKILDQGNTLYAKWGWLGRAGSGLIGLALLIGYAGLLHTASLAVARRCPVKR